MKDTILPENIEKGGGEKVKRLGKTELRYGGKGCIKDDRRSYILRDFKRFL